MRTIVLLLSLVGLNAEASAIYTVKDVGFNSCACAPTPVGNGFKINPGQCVFTITGKIVDGNSSTELTGIIATASNKIFDIEKNCSWDHSIIQIIYSDNSPTPEVVSISK